MLNKTHSLNSIVYLVGLHIYYKMIHRPYNMKLIFALCSFTNAPKKPKVTISFLSTFISSKYVVIARSKKSVIYFYINACLSVNSNGCAKLPLNNAYSGFYHS